VRTAKGYNDLSLNSVSVKEVSLDGTSLSLLNNACDISTNWLPKGDSTFSFTFEMNLEEIKSQLRLEAGDILMWSLRSYCRATQMQHYEKGILDLRHPTAISAIRIPNSEISSEINIRLAIAIYPVDSSLSQLGKATLAASRVWENTCRIYLSGSHTRWDVAYCDWSDNNELRNALWKIHTNIPVSPEDWRLFEISNSIRIELNSKFSNLLSGELFIVEMAADALIDSLRVVFSALDDPSLETQALDILYRPESQDGSWIQMARSTFLEVATSGLVGARENWKFQQSSVKAKMQNYAYRAVIGK